MGVLSGEQLKALSSGERPLISPWLDEEELEKATGKLFKRPQGGIRGDRYCLRLDSGASLVKGDSGREELKAVELEDGSYVYVIPPHRSVVVSTVERVTMPGHLFGCVTPHLDYMEAGIRRFVQLVEPGFNDVVRLHLHNDTDEAIKLHLYRGIAHLVVCTIEPNVEELHAA